jgi:hypothetical protein
MRWPQHRQMRIFNKPRVARPMLPTLRTWPCLAAVCLVGLSEWAALCRSRGVDAWHASRRRVRRG